MKTDTSENGLETLIILHMTGTDSLAPVSSDGVETIGKETIGTVLYS